MDTIVNNIIKILDWLQERTKTKAGIFILGLLLGIIPAFSVCWSYHKEVDFVSKKLVLEQNKILEVEKERQEWQDRAFNSEAACLTKMKEMASFFRELEMMYKTQAILSQKMVNTEEKKVTQYEKLTDEMKNLQKNLKDEK